jgi:Na+-translocating ferredoxin:NAD+ oxidoreductase RnfE subunit
VEVDRALTVFAAATFSPRVMLQNSVSDLRIALGLFVPLIFVAHVALGRRARLRAAALEYGR